MTFFSKGRQSFLKKEASGQVNYHFLAREALGEGVGGLTFSDAAGMENMFHQKHIVLRLNPQEFRVVAVDVGSPENTFPVIFWIFMCLNTFFMRRAFIFVAYFQEIFKIFFIEKYLLVLAYPGLTGDWDCALGAPPPGAIPIGTC